jgi:hypothetical protein
VRGFLFPEIVYDQTYPSGKIYDRTNLNIYKKYEQKFHKFLSFFDQLYKEGEGGYPLQNIGGEILRRTLRIVSEYYGYRNIWVGFSPVDGMHTVFNNEYVDPYTFSREFKIDLGKGLC